MLRLFTIYHSTCGILRSQIWNIMLYCFKIKVNTIKYEPPLLMKWLVFWLIKECPEPCQKKGGKWLWDCDLILCQKNKQSNFDWKAVYPAHKISNKKELKLKTLSISMNIQCCDRIKTQHGFRGDHCEWSHDSTVYKSCRLNKAAGSRGTEGIRKLGQDIQHTTLTCI